MVWYTAVQRIGSARTAIYSNLTPIVAMIVAAVWLGEQITRRADLGAAMILSGIAVTDWLRPTPTLRCRSRLVRRSRSHVLQPHCGSAFAIFLRVFVSTWA